MRFYHLLMFFGLALFAAGCSQEQQLENAQEDLAEERAETAEAAREAQADGVVTPDEQEEVTEEQGETAAAAGEVAEQTGEVIESQTDE
ncbi:MAG TPA: hypothetical protein VF170_15250 [Planctomycetaceae bacterium]